MSDTKPIDDAILRLTAACGPARSIDPADVAKHLVPEPPEAWRRQLSAVRRAACRLSDAGAIDILRKGKPVPSAEARGVIRLRARAAEEA